MSYFNSLGEVRSDVSTNAVKKNAVGSGYEAEDGQTKSAYDKAGLYKAFMSKYMPASFKYSM